MSIKVYYCSLFKRKVYSSDLFTIKNELSIRIFFLVSLSTIQIMLNELYKPFQRILLIFEKAMTGAATKLIVSL